jgi:hypothetical protein
LANQDGNVTIDNSGSISAANAAIVAAAVGTSRNVLINNSGSLNGGYSGIAAQTLGAAGVVTIINSGDVFGSNVGIISQSKFSSQIVNSGQISAGTGLAINTFGASSTIINQNGGVITGRVDLTDNPDVFNNRSGGTFEARGESDFGDGDDVFNNAGTVHALGETSFVNLEVFENAGLISMVDGNPRDVFTIDPPSGVAFIALSGSQLAVDAKLGGAGSKADLLVIDGDVDGKTKVSVNNAGGAGALNKTGIPVVEVAGSVGPKDFVLKGGPVDAGFFRYDLFFEPGDPNVFELRSAIGQNAFVLPQLTTAMQDLWHSTSDTWFDRTADLRMALYGAPGMAALAPTSSKLEEVGPAPGHQAVYPGLPARSAS